MSVHTASKPLPCLVIVRYSFHEEFSLEILMRHSVFPRGRQTSPRQRSFRSGGNAACLDPSSSPWEVAPALSSMHHPFLSRPILVAQLAFEDLPRATFGKGSFVKIHRARHLEMGGMHSAI